MRNLRFKPLLVSALFMACFQIGCNYEKVSSTESLVGFWQLQEITLSGNNGAFTITLKPAIGEVDLSSDGQFKGYYYFVSSSPKDKEELYGKALVDPVAGTILVTNDSYYLEPILYKYILRRTAGSSFLILEGNGPIEREGNWHIHIKVVLKRKN